VQISPRGIKAGLGFGGMLLAEPGVQSAAEANAKRNSGAKNRDG
jgi:hypothetical protein